MTIFEALREDHKTQRELIDELIATKGASDRRSLVYNKLKHELAIHADAEERFFYNPLILHDSTQQRARHSIAEHHELDELIEQLGDTEMDASNWLKLAKKLEHELIHHLDEEEHEIFQMAGKALNESEKTALAKDYTKYIAKNRIA